MFSSRLYALSTFTRSMATKCPIATNVYVSEGRDHSIIQRLQAIAQSTTASTAPSSDNNNAVKLGNVFIDAPYHRSSFTLVSYNPAALADRVAAMTAAAIKLIDLQQHSAQHPRLGVVDHISCHPLVTESSSSSMAGAVTAAEIIAKRLGLDPHLGLPVYLYGHAHPQQRQLVDIRRAFHYFKPTRSSNNDMSWKGALQIPSLSSSSSSSSRENGGEFAPDYGPPPSSKSTAKTGIVCVGAIPWLVNFNVLLDSSDGVVCKEIARAVSEKWGGLKAVQAMALKHDGGKYEVACNILDASVSPVEVVEKEIARLSSERGVDVVRSYRIGKKPEELMEILVAADGGGKG